MVKAAEIGSLEEAMRAIEILDQKTIDKIAAGEVVERPALRWSGAAEMPLTPESNGNYGVEIKEGGISIRITDNGCGITKDQVRLVFLRHATSKIRNVEDLADRIPGVQGRGSVQHFGRLTGGAHHQDP